MNGKGSRPRPIPDKKTFAENWDKIFGKREKKKETKDKKDDTK
jgi:hypothetical protein